METFMIIFLLINALIAGVAATIALQHSAAHRHEKKQRTQQSVPMPRMPAETRAHLLLQAEEKFEDQIEDSTAQLQKDINDTIDRLDSRVSKLGDEIIEAEMKRYRESLETIKLQTEKMLIEAQSAVSTHQAQLDEQFAKAQQEMVDKLRADIESEKERTMADIDTKMNDAVISFLLETMQHNVDLGAQTDYILSVLEANKADIIGEVKK